MTENYYQIYVTDRQIDT